MQIGWATKQCLPNTNKGEGIGDDLYSWAYDGFRRKKWHKTANKYSDYNWQKDDLITCLIDLDYKGGLIKFCKNGKDLGIAYKNFHHKKDIIYYPAISLSAGESCEYISYAIDSSTIFSHYYGNIHDHVKIINIAMANSEYIANRLNKMVIIH